MSKKILLIDDHAMFRTGVRMVLSSHIPNAKVVEAGSLNEALAGAEPDLVLLDIKLPGLNGVEGLTLLRHKWPEVPVLMLSALDEPETVRLASARGAAGFVSKTQSAEHVVEAVNSVLAGGGALAMPPQQGSALRLTPRQCEVLELICQGLSNKEIAKRLELSENTVRWHVQAILSLLNVSNRSAAAFAARQLGLVS